MKNDPFIRAAAIVAALAVVTAVVLGAVALGSRSKATQTVTIAATATPETHVFTDRESFQTRILNLVSRAQPNHPFTGIRCFRTSTRAAQCILHYGQAPLPDAQETVFVHCANGSVEDARNNCAWDSA